MKLLLLTILLFASSCKTFVIQVKPQWEIAEVRPYHVKCVRIGDYPRRFLRSRKQFLTRYRCVTSLELKKVRNRINRRY